MSQHANKNVILVMLDTENKIDVSVNNILWKSDFLRLPLAYSSYDTFS